MQNSSVPSIRQTIEEASSCLLPFLGAILTKLHSLRRERTASCVCQTLHTNQCSNLAQLRRQRSL
ncbi:MULTISPECIES: hypothetical protein [unclassified Microcoleus]|uniref:hypothetical protein n=1 Tax=unclassified Microcoleus TaxID=2642155 RepID=UPI002FD06EA1